MAVAVRPAWEEAFDAKIDLYNFWNGSRGEQFARGFAKALDVGLVDPAEMNATRIYDRLNEMEKVKLARAEPMYVSEEMLDLAEAASETFRPEPFQPTDLITPFGFVLLPRPHIITDAQGKGTTVRAFSWGPLVEKGDPLTDTPGRQGVWLSFYSAVQDFEQDESMLTADGSLEDGEQIEQAELDKLMSAQYWGTNFVLLHAVQWWFGDSPLDHVIQAIVKQKHSMEDAAEATVGWWRFIQAFLRLTMQYVSVRERHPVPRQMRRRAERAKIDMSWTTVITLRRPRHKPQGEGGTVEWKNRWLVGGHWRNQWYPSLSMHRQIWINDHIKGPEGLPLAIRKGRAFQLVR